MELLLRRADIVSVVIVGVDDDSDDDAGQR